VSDGTLPAHLQTLSRDSTLQPDATVRSGEHRAPQRQLPELSIDLRTPVDIAAVTREGSDFEVVGVIGEGGMGRVVLARQHSLARDVAVKTVKDESKRSSREALLEEGIITGQLEHPAIVPVHALGLDPSGLPAMVMKRIEGVSWDALLADPAHPGWEGWEGTKEDRLAGHLQILTSVCNAVHFAHSRRIVHRDIKPANVLIGRYGDVYLADWGVATTVGTTSQQLCGTPAYMAPEMVQGEAVDARTDVYLLGATLHVVLTGQPRHHGSTLHEALLSAQRSAPHSYGPLVPRELAALCNRACHVSASERPGTAQAFRDELTRYVRHRDARALGDQAIKRVAELEALIADPVPDDQQQRRIERLLLEARFGLEQALAQYAENEPARKALDRVDAIAEQRRARALELERDAHERDPRIGARWRTVALSIGSLITLAIALIATFYGETPTAGMLVAFPTVVITLFVVGAVAMRKLILDTRFNRQVYAALMASMILIVPPRIVALFVEQPIHEHFIRDSYVAAGVMFVTAMTLLPWTMLIAFEFLVAGILCQVFPESAIVIFTWNSVLAMVIATVFSRVLPVIRAG